MTQMTKARRWLMYGLFAASVLLTLVACTKDGDTVYQKATTEQQTLVEQLYSEWQGMNSGNEDDGSTVKTDVNDSYTDEPARSRKR